MASGVSAILLDAGGVMVFPRPDHVRLGLHAIGLDPDLATLERAHYQAMAAQAVEAEQLATQIALRPRSGSWAYAGIGVKDGLRALAAIGLPMGVVSNSDGS